MRQQDDLAKLATTTASLQTSVNSLGAGLKSVQELLQQLRSCGLPDWCLLRTIRLHLDQTMTRLVCT